MRLASQRGGDREQTLNLLQPRWQEGWMKDASSQPFKQIVR